MKSVLHERKYGVDVNRVGLPREAGPLAVERPAHRRSDQQVCQSACSHSYAHNPLSSHQRV